MTTAGPPHEPHRPTPALAHRPALADGALAAGLAAASLVMAVGTSRDPVYRPTDALALMLALASAGTVLVRRLSPLGALAEACVLVVVNAVAGYAIGGIQYPVWVGLWWVLASTTSRPARAAAVALAGAAVAGYVLADRGTVTSDVAVGIALLFGVALMTGEITRARRALAEADRARLALAASREVAERERAVLEERARLARELHDALGHAVNVMVMQAGVARHVFDERPAFARDALRQIETVGREALVELDGVLRALRPDEDPMVDRATPSLAGLDTLCERIRATGREVRLHRAPVALGPAGERAAFRIVQEALTNAARHGGRGPIEVTVAPAAPGGDPAVVLTVRNPLAPGRPRPPRTGTGRGVTHMRERARLEGGDLTCGPDPTGTAFVVRATLPAATTDAGTAPSAADTEVHADTGTGPSAADTEIHADADTGAGGEAVAVDHGAAGP